MKLLLNRKLIVIFCSLLAITAAIYAAQWKWHFWKSIPAQTELAVTENSIDSPVIEDAPVIEEEIAPENMADGSNQFSNQAVGIREVLSAHLFGQEKQAKTPNSSGVVPKTQQPLELHGIVYLPKHPERSVALIAQAGGVAKDYKVGEELQEILPGWKVFLIASDSVQIEHEGTVERLEVAASNIAQTSDNLQQTVMPAASAGDATAPNEIPQEDAASTTEEPPPPQETQPGMSNVEQPPKENPSELDNAQPPPAESNPAPEELSLKKDVDGLLLDSAKSAQALGLKQSDKIIAISGYDFTDLENDPSALKQILAQPRIEAVIDRNGEAITFDVPKNLIKNWRATIKS
jgi:type II secretory pathway component PulC